MVQSKYSVSHFKLHEQLKQISKYFIISVITIASLVLIGWQFEIEFLKRPIPNMVAMNPTTALCFLMIGISLLILNSFNKTLLNSILLYSLALIPFIVGCIKISGYIGNFDSTIDTIIFSQRLQTEVTFTDYLSNRMSPNGAFNLILAGIAIILTCRNNKQNKKLANYAALLITIISLFAIIGYIYEVKEFYRILSFIPMAIHTAIGFMLIGFALLFINADTGFMAVISHSNSGGTLARIMIPATIIIPILLGYIRLWIQWRYPISVELGVSSLITCIIVLFFILILYASFLINQKDDMRKEAEIKLAQINLELEQKIIDRTEELYRNEKLFRALVENEYSMTTMINDKFETIYRSPSSETIIGWTEEERNKQGFLDLVHPDDIESRRLNMKEVMENPGKVIHLRTRTKHKNGSYIWLEGISINKLHDPNVRGIITNLHNITEQKETEEKLRQNEEKFRALIENSADAIVLSDKSVTVHYQSPAVERMTGISMEIRKNNKGIQFTHPEDQGLIRKAIDDALLQPGNPIPFQCRLQHINGHYIWVEGVMTNLLDNKSVNAIVFNYRDVTERKKVEQEILKLNDELEDRVIRRTDELQIANKEMEAFTYSVSHDLRAPLRVIDGYSNILTEDYGQQLDEKGKKILNTIKTNAKRMGQLIDDLLNFSKLGKSEIRKVHVDMNKLLLEAIQELQLSGIVIPEKLEIKPLEPCLCDASLVKQVWINLLSNAIKYSNNQEVPTIEIGMKEDDTDTIYYIKDNGVGFDMKYAHKLFGVFQRLHKYEDFSGTGVGLAIVQRIISRHGGDICAESEVNKGAIFYFKLQTFTKT